MKPKGVLVELVFGIVVGILMITMGAIISASSQHPEGWKYHPFHCSDKIEIDDEK